jgi:hypothetical protein
METARCRYAKLKDGSVDDSCYAMTMGHIKTHRDAEEIIVANDGLVYAREGLLSPHLKFVPRRSCVRNIWSCVSSFKEMSSSRIGTEGFFEVCRVHT